MKYYSTLKKNETVAFAGKWVELGSIMLCEISQSPKTEGQMLPDMWMLTHNKGGKE